MRSRLLGLLLLATGCGSAAANSTPDLIPVTGLVTLDDKPIAGVTVMFNPFQGTRGTGAYGATDAEGRYKLLHRSEHDGCQEGEYGVTFTKIIQPDGSPLPKDANRAMVEQIPTPPSTRMPSSSRRRSPSRRLPPTSNSARRRRPPSADPATVAVVPGSAPEVRSDLSSLPG